MQNFYGQPVRTVCNRELSLGVLENVGPRIVCLSFQGAPNLFAELPDFTVPTDLGDYSFWGGHRLWRAPEVLPDTYCPDDRGLALTELEDGLLLEGLLEPQTRLCKSIEIHLAADKPEVSLVHTLTNRSSRPVELAPWSITQMKLGGTVIAPMPSGNSDPDGLLPNRQISLWPYTRVHDPRLVWEDDFIFFKAAAGLPPCKVGYFNSHGWLAYWINGILFMKTFDVCLERPHPDGNCNVEIYCNDRFVELEILAPLTRLAPGEKVRATESWKLSDRLEQAGLENVIDRVAGLSGG